MTRRLEWREEAWGARGSFLTPLLALERFCLVLLYRFQFKCTGSDLFGAKTNPSQIASRSTRQTQRWKEARTRWTVRIPAAATTPKTSTLPCQQALQWNCSALALGAPFVYFLRRVSTKNIPRLSTFCCFSHVQKKNEKKKKAAMSPVPYRFHTYVCTHCLNAISVMQLSSPVTKGTKTNFYFVFFLFCLVFLSKPPWKQDKEDRYVLCTIEEALHGLDSFLLSNILHLTHVAIPTGRGGGRGRGGGFVWLTPVFVQVEYDVLFLDIVWLCIKYTYINTCCTDSEVYYDIKQKLLEKNIYFYCFLI